MFINCPKCSALVATDLATDLPPERCPRCGFGMRADRLTSTPDTGTPAPPRPPVPAATPPAAPAPRPLVFVPLTPSRPAAAAPPVPGEADRSTEAPAAVPDPAVEAAQEPAPEAAPRPAPPEPEPEPDAETETDDAGPGAEVAAVPAAPAPPQAPGFLRRRHGAARPGLRAVALACGLAMLLVVQLMLADRERLAASAGWRPAVAALCGALRCSLPAWRDPAAITVDQRDVRPLPERPGVLRVSATIRNDARWPQAWPRLTLTLSDLDGRALGMRAFEPAEYLTAPPQHVTVASGESAAIRIDIVEPSPHAVAFNFQFH